MFYSFRKTEALVVLLFCKKELTSFLLVGQLFFCLNCSAVTKTWDGGAGTLNWTDAANWSPDGTPTASDSVVLDNSSKTPLPQITAASGANVATLTLNGTSGATILNYGGATSLVTNLYGDSVSNVNTGPLIKISNNASATVTINKVDFRLRTSGSIDIAATKKLILSNTLISECGGSFQLTKTGTGTLALSGSGGRFGMTGGLNIAAGLVDTSNNANALPPASSVEFINPIGTSANLRSTNSHTIGGLAGGNSDSLVQVTGVNGLTVNGNTDTIFGGVIADYGSLPTKIAVSGTGTLTFTNANLYTGSTTVTSGELKLAANASIASDTLTILSGAVFDVSETSEMFILKPSVTLAGSGLVRGRVKVSEGAIVSPGNSAGSPGTLTFTDGLTLDGGAHLSFDITSSGSDQIVITSGDISINADLVGSTLSRLVSVDEVFCLVRNDGSGLTVGSLAGRHDGDKITIGGQRFLLSMTSDIGGAGFSIGGIGNDIAIKAIYDPSPLGGSFDYSALASSAFLQTALHWSDNSNKELGYRILRRSNSSNFSIIATLPTDSTSYLDPQVAAATAYEYRIEAFDATGVLGDPLIISVPSAISKRRDMVMLTAFEETPSASDLKYEMAYQFARLLKAPPSSPTYLTAKNRILALLIANDAATSPNPTDPFNLHGAMHAYLAAKQHYSPEMIAQTKRVVQLPNYSLTGTYVSENFYFMYNGIGYLACEEWPDFTDSTGKTGATFKAALRSQLILAFDRIVRTNLWEHGSSTYYQTDLAPIRMIAEFAKDDEVKRKATATLDCLMLHLASDWNQGYYATSAARCKGWNDFTGSPESMDATQVVGWMFYGSLRAPVLTMSDYNHGVWMAYPGIYNTPPIFQQIAAERSVPFLNQSVMWKDNIGTDFKTAWHTPSYTLASMYEIWSNVTGLGKEQQPVCMKWVSDMPESTLILGSENHEQFYFSGRPHSLSVLPYDPVPNVMGYGTNPYFQHFQNRQTLVGVANVSPWYANSHPDLTLSQAEISVGYDALKYAELYIPFTQKGAIKKIAEKNGWVFVHGGSVLFAVWTYSPYYWGADISGCKMLRSRGLKNGWILETAAPSDYSTASSVDAQLQAFQEDILAHTVINTSSLNSSLPRIQYTSIHGYSMDLTWRPFQVDDYWTRGRFTQGKDWPSSANQYTNQASIDGVAVIYSRASWPLFNNPWVSQIANLTTPQSLSLNINGTQAVYNFPLSSSTWGRPPSISDISPIVIARGGTVEIPINIFEDLGIASSITLSGVSEDSNLVSSSNLIFSGTGSSRKLTISAGTSVTGSTNLLITARDLQGGISTRIVSVTVSDVPLLSVGSPSYTKLTLPQGVRSHEISAEVLSAGAGGVSLVNWSVVSGPIGTIFDSINSLTTTVRFSNIGVYVLECSATNEVGSGSVTVTIEVPALDLDFNSWISSNQYGLDINNRTINADPDKDGVSNLLEYILNGSPVVSDRNILPTLVVSGENFVFSFIQRNAAKTYAGLTFQYSSDLSTWIDVPIPVSSGSSGFFNFKFKENDGASEEVSISIPKTSLGSSSGFFGRICTTLLQQ